MDWSRAIWWWLTAAFAIAQGVFVLIGTPLWWVGLIAVVIPIAGILLGRPWQPPVGPQRRLE